MRSRRIFRKVTGKRDRRAPSELSTPLIHGAVIKAVERNSPEQLSGDHLDLGSGTGELLRLFAARYPLRSFACDYTDQLMEMPHQKVAVVDLNREKLPFDEDRFVLVSCVETIEHLENFRAVVREIYRVLRPGGIAVISTPNILNLRSRLRFLSSGFYNLFGPLAPDESSVHFTRGHITPVNWFYLAHALLSAGFEHLRVSVDKFQRRSLLVFPLFFVLIHLGNIVVYRRDAKKYRTLREQNAWIVRAMNSSDLLLGRTLIVTARKPR
jgi:SAM-dependent methyltransferase